MRILWLLWLFVVLPASLAQVGFGRSYLKNSRLCHQWNCINTKLGLPDSLPPRELSEATLKRVLPEGPWQDVAGKVMDHCYGNRTRRYTNTCPGQALMHCVVDQMIEFCPDSSWRKDDSCSPVSSLAGLKYMFAQSRYENLEKNLPRERRPSWFLKNYFDSKCCDLPVVFNTTVLEECGFSSVMNYLNHGPRYTDEQKVEVENVVTTPAPTTAANHGDTLKIVDFDQMSSNYDITNPLECCDMTKFIQPSWTSECDFHLSWGGQDRLVISSQSQVTEAPTTTTTERTDLIKDLMLLPHSCEKETCVFRKQGIINELGLFDIDAYMKMLHNFTNAHPSWTKATGRVLTKCLVKPIMHNYDTGCEINNILSCTFDVLTENCPYTKKTNICKHGKHDVGCQISSSKFRPKNRREICLLPELIHQEHLSECGLESLYRAEHVAVPPKPKRQGWFASKYTCKDSKAPTKCMMNKMGVLNKYNFMDYFKMKDWIRQFATDQDEWSALLDIYMSAFINLPMYGNHCNSERKLLNVIDAMLMTCPISKRKNTAQCNKIFIDMVNTTPVDKQNVTREKLDEILKHYHHVFMPNQPVTTKLDRVIRKKHSKTVKRPVFEFSFLNPKEAPPVKVISVKPEPSTKRTLILQPVYLRPNFGHRTSHGPGHGLGHGPGHGLGYGPGHGLSHGPSYGPIHDGVFRNNPFSLHEPIAMDHISISSTAPTVHPIPTIHSNLYATRPLIPVPAPILPQREAVTDFPIEMLKPE